MPIVRPNNPLDPNDPNNQQPPPPQAQPPAIDPNATASYRRPAVATTPAGAVRQGQPPRGGGGGVGSTGGGGGGGGLLSGLFSLFSGGGGGGDQGGQTSSLADRLGFSGGYDDDFRSRINKLGAVMMMMDPMSRDAGTAMLGLEQNRAANRLTMAQANQTVQWLQTQGLSQQEAMMLARNPTALNEWYKTRTAQNAPDWQMHELYNAKHEKVNVRMDMHSGKYQVLGGAAPPRMEHATTHDENGNEINVLLNMDDTSAPPIQFGYGKPQTPIDVAPGNTVFDPTTKKAIYTAPQTPKKENMIVPPGNTVYNTATNESVFTAPADASKAPQTETFYDDKGAEYRAQWDPQTKQWKQVGGTKLPTGWSITTNPDGTFSITQGGKETEGEQKTSNYLVRMAAAENDIVKYSDAAVSLWGNAAANTPNLMRKALQNTDFKMSQNAGKQWLAGVLRGDSGAAIRDDEWDQYGEMFLPQYGDDQTLRDQKIRMRAAAVRGMKAGMSPLARAQVLDAIAQGKEPPATTGQGGGDGQSFHRDPQTGKLVAD